MDILEMAVLAGRILLENGAETYRVEDTINRLCLASGLESVDNFTIPTGIFVSVSHGDHLITKVITIRNRDIDLEIISLINDFSRQYAEQSIDVVKAVERLKEIEKTPHYPKYVQILAGGTGGSFFALLFGSNLLEFILSFLTASVVMIVFRKLDNAKLSLFIMYVLSGITNMVTSLLLTQCAYWAGQNPRVELLAIGALMPLVPGVALTNAIRDIISGDFVSGMSRLLEAMVIALGIALGVGIVLNLNYFYKVVVA